MKNSTIIRVVVLGVIAIVSIIALQTYWTLKTWNVKEQEFHENVNLALGQVTRKLGEINTLPQYDLIERVSSNYYVVNVNQAINEKNLRHFLRSAFTEFGLSDKMQFAVYDCETNRMVGGDTVPESEQENLSISDLPTHDEYLYYFGVRFPNRKGQILQDMVPTMIFSGILLLTLLFFTYTIFVILRQKRLSEMQKDFINNMTHEFKTPISTIKISSDVFLTHPEVKRNERLFQYAKIIKEQNQRLNTQVEKVLQLASLERNRFQLKKESLDLNDLLQQILKGVALKVEKLSGNLEIDLDKQIAAIEADKLHLTNVIHNLLDNAIKYCNGQPQVSIKTLSTAKGVDLVIADKGIGIDKEHQEKVFQKFFRVPTGNIHNVKGFGLGLFYVKNISKAHGWKLNLKSEKNKGTEITISI